jgi:hypothetical protein
MKNIFLFIAIVFMASCNLSKKESANEYHQRIINLQDNISGQLKNLSASFLTHDSVIMYQNLAVFLKTTDSAINVVDSLQGFEGNTELKDAALNLFKYYKRNEEKEFPMEALILKKLELTDDDRATLAEIADRMLAEEMPLRQSFTNAENKMAKKYNFKLEKPEGESQE